MPRLTKFGLSRGCGRSTTRHLRRPAGPSTISHVSPMSCAVACVQATIHGCGAIPRLTATLRMTPGLYRTASPVCHPPVPTATTNANCATNPTSGALGA